MVLILIIISLACFLDAAISHEPGKDPTGEMLFGAALLFLAAAIF